RRSRRGWNISRHRPRQELTGDDDDQREKDAQADEAAREPVVADQEPCQRRNINGCRAIAADNQADNEPTLMRPEPLDRRRRGGRVSTPHADAPHDAEAKDKAGVAFQQARQDAAAGQKQAADGGADLRAVAILQPAAWYHAQGEDEAADGVGPRP